jgi:hypothetical protein
MKFSDYTHIAFSGSREGCPESLIESIATKIPPNTQILVGCARGVDAQVRAIYPDAKVYRATDYKAETYPAKLAMRSSAMVADIHAAGGCLIAVPMKPCPPKVKPCTTWRSSAGSGTWGTIALAAGLGVPTAVWLPESIQPPDWDDRFSDKGSGWFLVVPF